MDYNQEITPTVVLHWNYRGFTEFPLQRINGEEADITDIYLKENLISKVPSEICRLENLESLYLSGNDITVLPKEISKLKCLKCLDLSGNRLRNLPDEIGEMRNLKYLILDENELTDLPLRLSELRAMQYLSVCDNKIQWLPQRPVYNYHHCEFRFWRNSHLKTMPYSLWYHMFRDQQTRSLNIGCLQIPSYYHSSKNSQIRISLKQDSRQCYMDIEYPSHYTTIFENSQFGPPTLFELSRRLLYQMISDTAKKKTADADYSEIWKKFYETSNSAYDLNGNTDFEPVNVTKKMGVKKYYVAADILDEYFTYLPHSLRADLCNGPMSRCENFDCKRPVFDYVFYEFCLGKLILIDNVQDVILSATFCSKSCSDKWKIGKVVLPWTFR